MLPHEILLSISTLLDHESYQNLRRTCTAFSALPREPHLCYTAYLHSLKSEPKIIPGHPHPLHRHFHLDTSEFKDEMVKTLLHHTAFDEISRILTSRYANRVSEPSKILIYAALMYTSLDHSLRLLYDWRSAGCFCGDTCYCHDARVRHSNTRFGAAYEHLLYIMTTDPVIAPVSYSHGAFRIASRRGYTRIITHTLKERDPPLDLIDTAFCLACENGHTDIMQVLLAHGYNVHAAAHESTLGWAAGKNHVGVVQRLIEIGLDPSGERDMAIRLAASNGHAGMVRLLLKDTRVDPSVCQDWALRYACMNGHVEVVRLLLSDARVDPAVYGNVALKWAFEKEQWSVVRVLMADARMKFSFKVYGTVIKHFSKWKSMQAAVKGLA